MIIQWETVVVGERLPIPKVLCHGCELTHTATKLLAAFKNRAIPKGHTQSMSFDVMEEGTPCDYCGQPIGFMDDDWAVCAGCRTEYINMDFEGGDLESESPLEY